MWYFALTSRPCLFSAYYVPVMKKIGVMLSSILQSSKRGKMYIQRTKAKVISSIRSSARCSRMRELCIEQVALDLSFGEWVEPPQVKGFPGKRNRVNKASVEGDAQVIGMIQCLTFRMFWMQHRWKSILQKRTGYVNWVGLDSWRLRQAVGIRIETEGK